MNLTNNVFYILLPLVFLGLVVFFIVKHFRNICTPKCDNKICGPNGCGGNCGTCPEGKSCSPDGTSCNCVPACTGKVCGPDGCGGNCGTCPAGKSCSSDGTSCICDGACNGRHCGPDACGGGGPNNCGTCPAGKSCSSDGTSCICDGACNGRHCGPDACGGGGPNNCGTCQLGQSCDSSGKCVDCPKQCDQKVCGPDGCGGVCGNCIKGFQCSQDHKSCTCMSDCTGKICGPDNCNVANACGDPCSADGKVCASDGKSCTNPPEIYYYNPNTGGDYTKINAQKYADTPGNVSVATYEQVLNEYQFDYGLDSCYLGWTDTSFDVGSDVLEMVNPYKTQIPSSTFCSIPNTNNISKNPSTSRPYEDDIKSAGLYLYGVKPNLPDCNNSNPNNSGNPCVGRYNKDKMSKYDP